MPLYAPSQPNELRTRVWPVGALCKAVGDTLEARYNPVTVVGELTGFSKASSGHCYFSLKDRDGQIKCAMFRRAASLLDFLPRDGEKVEVRGRVSIYEMRGDLQLVVESMSRAGKGNLFEAFMALKARLESQGLFDQRRKRPLPLFPKCIGLVTSSGAAALHDVATALQRRAPHVNVVFAPAMVQGAGAAAELVSALQNVYHLAAKRQIDVILLVRGGGSMEDLWAFNDETLAHTLANSPVPVVCGVGHETDFTIADFVCDLRAPTPTAAAELATPSKAMLLGSVDLVAGRITSAVHRRVDTLAQHLDWASQRLGRPTGHLAGSRLILEKQAQRLQLLFLHQLEKRRSSLNVWAAAMNRAPFQSLEARQELLVRQSLQLALLNPRKVLERGFTWLSDTAGTCVSSVHHTHANQLLRVTFADGDIDVNVV